MSGKDNVCVAIRCRPLSQKEIKDRRKSVVRVDQVSGQVTVQNPKAHSGEKGKTFTFDTVFGSESKQVDVYNETARPIVDFVLEGYNGTIFAYGQTGTGKTFTMEGESVEPEKRGIIPNSFAHIFGHIAKSEGEVQFLVRVAYLELYNEEVRDLLSKTPLKKLEIRERVDIGVYVKDLSSFVVKNADEMDKLMSIGNKNRTPFANTEMNERSSRSHVIFTTTIEQGDLGPDKQQHVRMGKLHLVDLAGSERQSKTGAQGERFIEAVKINLSLSTLGNVISALVDGRSTHIPYRNSKLTRLLQDSLGGNSKTVMIANIGPADYNCEETFTTLRYANRAKNIKNNARINEDPKDAMLREFQKEINELKLLLEEADDSEGSGDENTESTVVGGKKLRRNQSAGSLSPRSVASMKAEIERERIRLMATKGLAEGEKDEAQKKLEEREEELRKAQEQQSELEKKLNELNSKVIKGGVNLLEQAEEQERLLESSAKELEKRKKKEGKLKEQLDQKEVEKLDMEEKYATLQEEAAGKTRLLKRVWKEFQQTKDEIAEMKAESQHENEQILDMIRELNKEVKLQTLVINGYIPQEYQEKLEEVVQWHEETGDWHMPGVAYAGNHMRKQQTTNSDIIMSSGYDTTTAYLTYNVGMHEVHSLSTISGKSGGFSTRPKAARTATGASISTTGKAKKEEKAPSNEDYPKTRGLVSRQQRFA